MASGRSNIEDRVHNVTLVMDRRSPHSALARVRGNQIGDQTPLLIRQISPSGTPRSSQWFRIDRHGFDYIRCIAPNLVNRHTMQVKLSRQALSPAGLPDTPRRAGFTASTIGRQLLDDLAIYWANITQWIARAEKEVHTGPALQRTNIGDARPSQCSPKAKGRRATIDYPGTLQPPSPEPHVHDRARAFPSPSTMTNRIVATACA